MQTPAQIVGTVAELMATALIGILLDRWLGTKAAVVGLCICLTLVVWLNWKEIEPISQQFQKWMLENRWEFVVLCAFVGMILAGVGGFLVSRPKPHVEILDAEKEATLERAREAGRRAGAAGDVSPPEVKPPQSPPLQIAPVYGNLKQRSLDLSQQIAQLVHHREVMFDNKRIYPRPLTKERYKEWEKSNDAELRPFIAQVKVIRDEFRTFHIEDNELNEILKHDEENDQYRKLSPGEPFYWMGWINIADMKIIAVRLTVLANQVPQ